ncbi:MAG: DUF559 domain-containing protein [Candidatus Moranbacteria bacterium]|nr:DUF559 domain-containing protein [Candidatus Moranbacteria bacterium]
MEENHKCIYCGEEATFQLKNGNWCCKSNARSCPAIKEKVRQKALEKWKELKDKGIKNRSEIPDSDRVKDLGQEGVCYYCGGEASFQLKNGRWCCQEKSNQCPKKCPKIREKNSRGYKPRGNRISHSAWNKGLTKETDERVKKTAKSLHKKYESGLCVPFLKGKKHTEEEKAKISTSMKKFMSEHPDRVPYKLNHSSKTSYPERYFKFVFQKEKIDLKYHFQVGRYELDFYNETSKKYVEIDSESHYLDKKTVKIDKERNEYLNELGWTGYRIRWKDYKKLSLSERTEKIKAIKDFLCS